MVPLFFNKCFFLLKFNAPSLQIVQKLDKITLTRVKIWSYLVILLFSKRVHCTWVGRNIDWTRDKLLQIIHLQCNNKFWEFKIHTKTQVECFLFIKTRLIFVDILLCRVQALFDSYVYHDILMPSNSQGCFLKEPLIGYSRKKNKGIWGHTFLKTPMNFYFIPGNSTLF